MASITGTTTLGTRNNEHLEKAAEENELKINKNDNESGESNEGSSTGEKNEDGGKPSEEKEAEAKQGEDRSIIRHIKSPAGRNEECSFPRLSKEQSTTKK
jgi:hypothetical protein